MSETLTPSFAEPHARMTQAVMLARGGEYARAEAAALALARTYPADLNILHQTGVVLQIGGALDEALGMFHAALALCPGFHYSEMEVANTLLALRRPAEAAEWYLRAAASEPSYGLAFRRAGEVLHGLGRHAEALRALQQAHGCDPTDPEVAAALATLLVFHNRRDAAAEVFAALLPAGRMRATDHARYLKLLTELGQFDKVVANAALFPDDLLTPHGYEAAVLAGHAALAASFDLPALVAAATARQQSERWLSTQAVLGRLRAAIAARAPLSLIRVGDGEARFLAYGDPALRGQLSATHAQMLGDVPFRNWFGRPVSAADTIEIARLRAATITAMEQADILGVTAADRLAGDNLHVGYLGHMEALVAGIFHTEPQLCLTDAMVHVDLHRASPFYREVLAGLDFLGVVSPHPGLAQRLAEAHGIGQVVDYLLPGESRLPRERQNRGGPAHFPDVYRSLYRNLAVPRPGAVFLVAGGLLGKIYCHVIRQRGGIAIDAGSIVDGWMGHNTRPGVFDRRQEWAL